jgi:phenylpropionate dioxygenase-like ring-hydroxylating dioxygenase large terminal subunit
MSAAMKPEIVAAEPAVERVLRPMPKEGDDGLYTQSWYPICLSTEVETGQVISREFLGGRVIVFRGENGVVSVLSPYCTHMGMDLSFGEVVGNNIRCRYHHYEFDAAGRCTKTGWDQPPPQGACQFSFPTRDRYGIVWAFNGTKPLFELPDMALPDEELVFESWVTEAAVPCSPTEVFVQVADWGHLRFMHEGTVQTTENQQNMKPDFKFSQYNFGYQVAGMTLAGPERGKEGGQEFPQVKIYVHGTTIIHIETYVQGNWAGVIGTTALRGPGKTQIFGAVAVARGDDSPEAMATAKQQLAFHKNQVQVTGAEDFVIYENIRFAPGALTEIDDMVVKYLDYVAAFPRANPAANFIYG